MPEEIEQVDADLAEDGCTIVLMGHTADEDVTCTSSVSLPIAINEDALLRDEWSSLGNMVQWCRHE